MKRVLRWAWMAIALVFIVDGTFNLLGVYVWHIAEWMSILWIVLGASLLGISIIVLWYERKAVCPTDPALKKSDIDCN